MKKHHILILILSISSFSHAQDVEEVVTSALADPSQIENPLHLVKSVDLEAEPTTSLGEALDNLAGVGSADYGAAIGQPIIRGLSGARIKVLNNGLVVRDVAGIGVDHPNDIDLSNATQVEVVRGPSSLLYANGTIGGIINIVDNSIAKTDFDGFSGSLGYEMQEVNDGSVSTYNFQHNVAGLNFSLSGLDSDFENYVTPRGSVIEDGMKTDESIVMNSDSAADTGKFGVSKTGDWGYIGMSLSSAERVHGIPFHAEEHGHNDPKPELAKTMDEGEEEGEEHEGERIFAMTDSDIFTLQGSLNLSNGLVNKVDYFLTSSDYSLIEQHAEEEGHDGHDEPELMSEGDGEPHHDEEPTLFTNDATEFGMIFDLSNAMRTQKISMNFVEEDMAIVGEEAFMRPTMSEEFTIGYFMSQDIGFTHLDFGIRFDDITRDGSIAEHHDDPEPESAKTMDADEEEIENYSFNYSTTNYSLQVSQGLTDNLSVVLSATSAERAPGAQELFINGPHLATRRFEVGNVNLNPEKSNNLDMTMNYEAGNVFAKFTSYTNNVDDYIYLMDETDDDHDTHEAGEPHPEHGDLILAEYLQNDAKFTGYEFELGNSFQLENGTLTATVGLDAVEGKFKNSQMFVPRMMPKRRFINFDYVSGDYSAGVSYKEVQPQDKVTVGETGTDGYRMLDLDASKSYDLGDGVTFRSSVFIKNLLDETARNHTSFVKNEVPLAGRNVGFKFRITF
jgi:iron complex outermembrane receptor protein